MAMTKPYSAACERNKKPIFEILKELINDQHLNILEIGSGTGQHALYFAENLPNITWQTSDLLENHQAIKSWIDDQDDLENILSPLHYQAGQTPLPTEDYDLYFSANTLHIMSFNQAKVLFEDLGKNLKSGALFVYYGPFNYQGKFTSKSNEEFDQFLKMKAPHMGIRDFEEVCELLSKEGIELLADHEMPANNRMLIFKKD